MVVSFVLVDELATAVQMKRNEKAGPIVAASEEDTTEPPTKRKKVRSTKPATNLGSIMECLISDILQIKHNKIRSVCSK